MTQTIRQRTALLLEQVTHATGTGEWPNPPSQCDLLITWLQKAIKNPADDPAKEIRIRHRAQDLAAIAREAIKSGTWKPDTLYPEEIFQFATEHRERRIIEHTIPRMEAMEILEAIESRETINARVAKRVLLQLNCWDENMLSRLQIAMIRHRPASSEDAMMYNGLLSAVSALVMSQNQETMEAPREVVMI